MPGGVTAQVKSQHTDERHRFGARQPLGAEGQKQSAEVPCLCCQWHWTEHSRLCKQRLPVSVLSKMLQMQLIIDSSEELAMSATAKEWKNYHLNM